MPRRLVELCLKEPAQLEGNTIYVIFHRIANGTGAGAVSNEDFTYSTLTQKGKKEKLKGKNAKMPERTQEDYTDFVRDIEKSNKAEVNYKRLIDKIAGIYDRSERALIILEGLNLE